MQPTELSLHAPYQVAFDVTANGYTEWRLALVPACVGLGAFVLLQTGAAADPSDLRLHWYRMVLRMGIGVTIAMTVVIVAISWREYVGLVAAVRDNQYQRVEGCIADFVPESAGGHRPETFRVGATGFEYSTYQSTSGFHRTVPKGGPLHAGLCVRIADVDGKIARLEIAR